MYCFNVFLQDTLSGAAVVTNDTFELFLFLMNWFMMFVQVTFLGAYVLTNINITFEWFLFFMDWLDMFFSSPSFVSSCSRKCDIWMVTCSHELIQDGSSNEPFGYSCSHNSHIWIVSFSHELIQYVSSSLFLRSS